MNVETQKPVRYAVSVEQLSFDLVDRLRKAMRIAGMTGGDIAEHLDVSRATVTNWINGHTKPRRRDLMAVAAVTGVPAVWLATGELPTVPSAATEPAMGIEAPAAEAARADYGSRTRDLFFTRELLYP